MVKPFICAVSTLQSLAYLRGTDIIQVGIYHRHGTWQPSLLNVIAWTTIHQYAISSQYLLIVIPTVEIMPIVGANNKLKRVLRIGSTELRQCVDHIRGQGKAAFKIRHTHTRHALSGQLRHAQTMSIRSDRFRLALFKRIERRNEQTQLIHKILTYYRCSQLRVTTVYRIEGSSIYSYYHLICLFDSFYILIKNIQMGD